MFWNWPTTHRMLGLRHEASVVTLLICSRDLDIADELGTLIINYWGIARKIRSDLTTQINSTLTTDIDLLFSI